MNRGWPKSWRHFLWVLTLALFAASGAEAAEEQAIPSRLATKSLLVDVARANGRLVTVGEWGHVLLSDDSGGSWRQAESVPTRATLTAVTFVDAKRGWAVGHDVLVIHTRDGGETWELQHQDLGGGGAAAHGLVPGRQARPRGGGVRPVARDHGRR